MCPSVQQSPIHQRSLLCVKRPHAAVPAQLLLLLLLLLLFMQALLLVLLLLQVGHCLPQLLYICCLLLQGLLLCLNG
jgi:hypothetical protein